MPIDFLGSRGRATHSTFLVRLLLGLLSGYFAGALGGAVVFSYLSTFLNDLSQPSIAIHGNVSVAVLGLLVAPLAAAVFLTEFLLFAMVPAALASLPLVIAAALFARMPLVPAMLYGSLVGMSVGWPAAMRYFGDWEPSLLPLAAAAGASFMVPLWHFTIGFDLRQQSMRQPAPFD